MDLAATLSIKPRRPLKGPTRSIDPGWKDESLEPGVTPELKEEEPKPAEPPTRTVEDWGIDIVQSYGTHQAFRDPDVELSNEDYLNKKRHRIYEQF